jgi:tRNA G46 methylase TrmB
VLLVSCHPLLVHAPVCTRLPAASDVAAGSRPTEGTTSRCLVACPAATAVLRQTPSLFSTALQQPVGDAAGAVRSAPLIVCVGLGGGSLPAFLSHHFPGAQVVAVELDPLVVKAAREAMGLTTAAGNLTIVEVSETKQQHWH